MLLPVFVRSPALSVHWRMRFRTLGCLGKRSGLTRMDSRTVPGKERTDASLSLTQPSSHERRKHRSEGGLCSQLFPGRTSKHPERRTAEAALKRQSSDRCRGKAARDLVRPELAVCGQAFKPRPGVVMALAFQVQPPVPSPLSGVSKKGRGRRYNPNTRPARALKGKLPLRPSPAPARECQGKT